MGTTTVPRSARTTSSLGALTTSIVLVLVAVAALFLRPQPAEARVYTYALEAGQTRVYAMTTRMSMQPMGIPGHDEAVDETMTGKMTMTVVEVAPDGSALIEMALSEMAVGGVTAPAGSNDPIRMRVSKTGKLLSVEGGGLPGLDLTELMGGTGGAAAGSPLGSTNLFPVYPSDAIAPGDSWTEDQDVPLPFGDGTMHVTASGTHDGFEDTDYGRAARVRMKFASPMDLSFTFADLMGMLAGAFSGSGSGSGSDGLGMPAGAALPPGLDKIRMVIGGRIDGDMVATAIPETGDLTGMQMDMKMDISMRLENVPPQMSALMSGMPTTFDVVGDMTMTLDRIS